MTKWMIAIAALVAAVVFLAATDTQSEDKMAETQRMEKQAEVAFDYSDASDDVRTVALAIRMGEVPDQALLERIGAERLSAKYLSKVHSDSTVIPYYLLNDTMTEADPPNFAAAEALVKAGADVNYSNNGMVFNALAMMQGPQVVPFPDYSPGIPFLKLYLENGGDPNAQDHRGNWGFNALRRAHNNLEGVLVLLEHGADPWFQAPDLEDQRPQRSFFNRLVGRSGNGVPAELLFRVAHAGYFKDATPEQLQSAVFDQYEQWLKEIEGSNNPADLRQAWHFQTILDAIVETSGVPLPPELARLMENRVPDKYGGWWMRPDQIRSGDEFVGPMITDGALIWTHADPTPHQRPDK